MSQNNSDAGVVVALLLSVETGEVITVKNMRHRNPQNKPPGGRPLPDESLGDAIIREVWEETKIPKEELEVFQPQGKEDTFPKRMLAKSENYYIHAFIVLAKNFNKASIKLIPDGDDLLKTVIHKNVNEMMKQPIVSYYRPLLTVLVKLAEELAQE